MTYPHFIIIGAMKCGTSTLAAQLGGQEGIFITDPKEPNYFSDDAVFARGQSWYATLFSSASSDDLRGEASTHYTKRPDYPQTITRMCASLDAPRFVYMIRNPMERLVSHYIHAWSEGELSDKLEASLSSHSQLVKYGLYGWQISPFIETFGRDAVLLTSLERLKMERGAELERIAAHIGHAGSVRWREDLEMQNVSANRVRKLPLHKLLIDSPVATLLRRTFVPKALRSRIRARRQMNTRPEIPALARANLEAQFSQDRAILAYHFPKDPTLMLAYPFLNG